MRSFHSHNLCFKPILSYHVNMNASWLLAIKSFGFQATTHFLHFPSLYTNQRTPSFNILPGVVFLYFGCGINQPQLTVQEHSSTFSLKCSANSTEARLGSVLAQAFGKKLSSAHHILQKKVGSARLALSFKKLSYLEKQKMS